MVGRDSVQLCSAALSPEGFRKVAAGNARG